MSDQLTLEGLLSSDKPNPDEPKTQKKVRKVAPKNQGEPMSRPSSEDAISARINALIQQKAETDKQLIKTNPVEQKVAQPIPPKKIIVQEVVTASPPSTSPPQDSGEEFGDFEELAQAKPSEPEVLTVSSLNKSIKNLLEKNFPFLWVKGEISNLKIPSSGHIYFTLKDSTSQVRSVMFRGFAQSMKFKPEDGMEVLVRCKVTAYEPRGDYQLFCEVMEPVGFGALQIAFEKLKAKLQAEGLFDPKRKRPLPPFPSRIAIVTSPTGAAIRDMVNVLTRRFGGGIDITVIPSSVQGDKAPGEIVKAIELVNRLGAARFDVLIVGRGGGSLEDLWAFNEEIVARAVSQTAIPTISAVGHEVDFTICDFVADLRAPTPSAAAELVVKNKKDLLDRVQLLRRQVVQQTVRKLQLTRANVEGFSKRLIDPKRRLQDLMLRCDEWTDRLVQSMQRYIQDSLGSVKLLREKLGNPEERLKLCEQRFLNSHARMRLAVVAGLTRKQDQFGRMAGLLNGLSPLAVLDRGYSIVKSGEIIVKDAKQVKGGDVLTIKLHAGEIKSKVVQD